MTVPRVFAVMSAALWLLTSCAAMPPRSVGLEEFVHNMSMELDCLLYCAGLEGGRRGTALFLKDPLEVELSVNSEGRVTGGSVPNVFTVTGLTVAQAQERAGNLRLRLSLPDTCPQLVLAMRGRDEGEKPGGRAALLHLEKASYFLQTIGGKEYVYVQGLTGRGPGKKEVFSRVAMDQVEKIECMGKPEPPIKAPAGCVCPGKAGPGRAF